MKTTAHRNGRRYTTDELRKLMAMWEANASPEEIGEALGTTWKAILCQVGRMRRDGIPLTRRRKGHRAGRFNKPWTQEEIEYVFRRRLTGDTAETIAADLDRTYSGVAGIITKLRREGAPIAMRGNGVRRLWSVEALKAAAIGRFDDAEIRLAEQLPS